MTLSLLPLETINRSLTHILSILYADDRHMACNPLQVQLDKLKEAERLAKNKQAEGRVSHKDDNLVKNDGRDSGN